MLKNAEGQKIPEMSFKVQEGCEWKEIHTDEIFSDKTVIVFSLPGAFTPTCSSTHLPGYEFLAEKFKKNGVDDIFCLSVNDSFVMNEWHKKLGAKHVRVLPDGNGEFTQKIGMLADKASLGFGKRSWRYSMLVRKGSIEKMFIEPEVEGDPFEVSDAETMLHYLNPDESLVKAVTILTRPGCPHCQKAKELLREHHLSYDEMVLNEGLSFRSLRALSGSNKVPQVFIDGKHIGGADKLEEFLKK